MNELFSQIRFPFILSPMLGVVTPEMVAEVSNSGGLGNLPLGAQPIDSARKLISKTKRLTNKIFSVNLFANPKPDLEKNSAVTENMRLFIQKIVKEKGWSDSYKFDFFFYPYQDLIDLIIEEGIKVVSFTFGILEDQVIQKLKEHNITLIGNATCTEEAVQLENSDVDFVVAQGIEAGGHRASFVQDPIQKVGLLSLVSQIKQEVKIPVIAAGGIYNRDTMRAAFDAGASAVQIGTHFIPATESLATDEYRKILRNATGESTVLTKGFSGRWARGIRNEFMEITEAMDIPDYPIQNVLTRKMRNLAKDHEDYEYTSLWAGQNARFAKTASTREIMNELILNYKSLKH